MSSPNQVSFLPEDYLDGKIQKRTSLICTMLFAIVIAAVGVAFWMTEKSVKAVGVEHDNVNRQFLEAAIPIERFHKMQDQRLKMELRAALSSSLIEKAPRSYLLAEVTRSLPAHVSLLDFGLDSRPRVIAAAAASPNAFEIKKPDAKTDTGPRYYDVSFKITGTAENDMQVAAFMNQLARSPLFREVNLVVSDEFQLSPKDVKLRKFQIEMNLTPDVEIKPPERQSNTKVAEADVN